MVVSVPEHVGGGRVRERRVAGRERGRDGLAAAPRRGGVAARRPRAPAARLARKLLGHHTCMDHDREEEEEEGGSSISRRLERVHVTRSWYH